MKIADDTILYHIRPYFYTADFKKYLQLINYDQDVKFTHGKITRLTCHNIDDTFLCNIHTKRTKLILNMTEEMFNILIIYMKYDNIITDRDILSQW
jgi:hypothetical protein